MLCGLSNGIQWPWMTLKVIDQLQAFSDAIHRTLVQHFTRFQLRARAVPLRWLSFLSCILIVGAIFSTVLTECTGLNSKLAVLMQRTVYFSLRTSNIRSTPISNFISFHFIEQQFIRYSYNILLHCISVIPTCYSAIRAIVWSSDTLWIVSVFSCLYSLWLTINCTTTR